jgi:type I restriction enzyme S subunit
MPKDSLHRLGQHGVKAIPAGWRQSRVKYLGTYINGYPFKPDDWGSTGRPILRIQDLSSPNTEPHHFDGEIPNRYLVRYGDILISWSASLGVYRWTGDEAWLNQHIFKVEINTKYVRGEFFIWLANWFIGEMDRELHGSTMQHLTADAFGGFPVVLPTTKVQIEISSYLVGETARIDALISAKERVLDLLTEKRRALITSAVTRGLNDKSPMKNTSVEWLTQVPLHWTQTKVRRLFRQTKRLGFPELTILSVYRDYGVIERASRDDNANRVPEDLDKYQLVGQGDLVINKMKAWQGSLGISDLRGITSPDYVVFSPLHSEMPRFLHFLLRNSLLTTVYLSMSNGIRTNQWRIEPDRFGELSIFLPPVEEQRSIVDFIDSETSKLAALHSATERTIALLRERRAGLITAVVTGQIDIAAAGR